MNRLQNTFLDRIDRIDKILNSKKHHFNEIP